MSSYDEQIERLNAHISDLSSEHQMKVKLIERRIQGLRVERFELQKMRWIALQALGQDWREITVENFCGGGYPSKITQGECRVFLLKSGLSDEYIEDKLQSLGEEIFGHRKVFSDGSTTLYHTPNGEGTGGVGVAADSPLIVFDLKPK